MCIFIIKIYIFFSYIIKDFSLSSTQQVAEHELSTECGYVCGNKTWETAGFRDKILRIQYPNYIYSGTSMSDSFTQIPQAEWPFGAEAY